MSIKCILFGCIYKGTQGKMENGIFRIKGKCIRCGKEKVLVEEPWSEVQRLLNIP